MVKISWWITHISSYIILEKGGSYSMAEKHLLNEDELNSVFGGLDFLDFGDIPLNGGQGAIHIPHQDLLFLRGVILQQQVSHNLFIH